MPLLKMRVLLPKRHWTTWAAEGPTRCHFYWWFSCEVRHKKIHGNILTIHEFIHFLPKTKTWKFHIRIVVKLNRSNEGVKWNTVQELVTTTLRLYNFILMLKLTSEAASSLRGCLNQVVKLLHLLEKQPNMPILWGYLDLRGRGSDLLCGCHCRTLGYRDISL